MARVILAVMVAAALALAAACGGGGGASQPAGSVKVTMTEFKFDPATPSVPGGKTTFFLVNAGSVPHNMVIFGPGGKRIAASDLVQGGNSSVFAVPALTPGTYQIVCDQPGHQDAGMKGTLTVT
jgi:plastocyanin